MSEEFTKASTTVKIDYGGTGLKSGYAPDSGGTLGTEDYDDG